MHSFKQDHQTQTENQTECQSRWMGQQLQTQITQWPNSWDLKVVNDLAERNKKDSQEHADLAKDSAYREDIPLVVLNHFRAFQDLQKQTLL